MSRVAALLNLVKFSFLFHLKRKKKKGKKKIAAER
jgi:hypothetical protein